MHEFISNIINNKINESSTLEFKCYYFENGEYSKLKDREKNNLFKEICGFANADGGRMIIGIKEDENHNPISVEDTGVSINKFEMWKQSFISSVNSKIKPQLYGINCYHAKASGKNCIVITVEKSLLKPHARFIEGHYEFFIRQENTCAPMHYDLIKHQFLLRNEIVKKAQFFRDTRISMINGGDVDVSISGMPALILHIIPEWSLDDENYFDLYRLKGTKLFNLFSPPGTRGMESFNADGYRRCSLSNNSLNSYIQIFHNCSIECAEFRLMCSDKKGNIFSWNKLEDMIAENLYNNCLDLVNLGIPHSFYLSVSIINAKHKRSRDGYHVTPPLQRNYIKSVFSKWNSNMDYSEAVVPILNSISNAFGYSKSKFVDDDLNISVEKFENITNRRNRK